MDVSNFQPRDLTSLIQQYQTQHVVVRLWLPQEIGKPDYSAAQLASARENGCSVSGYWWLYASMDAAQQARDACAQARVEGVDGVPLWVDIEPYTDNTLPTVEQIQAAVDTCRFEGITPGIYTGAWLWGRLGNPTQFSDLPLWAATYDGQQTLDVPMFGGWTECKGHQYQGDPDLDVFDASVCG